MKLQIASKKKVKSLSIFKIKKRGNDKRRTKVSEWWRIHRS